MRCGSFGKVLSMMMVVMPKTAPKFHPLKTPYPFSLSVFLPLSPSLSLFYSLLFAPSSLPDSLPPTSRISFGIWTLPNQDRKIQIFKDPSGFFLNIYNIKLRQLYFFSFVVNRIKYILRLEKLGIFSVVFKKKFPNLKSK